MISAQFSAQLVSLTDKASHLFLFKAKAGIWKAFGHFTKVIVVRRKRIILNGILYLKKLNAWLGNEASDPLVLYAESGSGKSSLMAFWCEQLRRRQPELHIIEHYVGIGAGDTDHLGIIKHVLEEIKQRYNRSETIPSKPADLEREFANWLGFGIGAPMLIIIDGVNQLTGHALTLHWIPEEVPEGVRLVVSSTVEGTLVDLRKRGWSELGMQPLSEAEREAVIVRFLAEYGKSLAGDQVRRIASDAKCAHPLFLRTLLEEIRLYGLHEQLDRLIDDLLARRAGLARYFTYIVTKPVKHTASPPFNILLDADPETK